MARIVVGVDGSESSRRALAWAAADAEARHEDLLLVQSWHEPMLGGPGFSAGYETDIAFHDAQAALESVSAATRDRHPDTHITSALVDGRPAASLVAQAEGAGLLVVGSRGNGGFLGLELGSVSMKAARRSSVPVVVVRGGGDCSARNEVVVGVDGSECSRDALRWAASWAEAHDKVLVVLLAWNYLEPQGPHGPDRFRPDYGADDADAALESIVSDVLGPWRDPRVVTEAVCDLPARAVLDRASDACLIVVGRHGTSVWAPPELGATALQILHHAACPVAVIPDGGPGADPIDG